MSSTIELPPDFDPDVYRSLYPDVASFGDVRLATHYRVHGRREGRRAHTLATRGDFAALAANVKALEIGPFANPMLAGGSVRYADINSTGDLRRLAEQLDLDPNGVPNIDWVVTPNDLGSIDERFDAVLSSHAIEHQPNLVGHLRQVSRLLNDGGRYFVLVPDYRYCFDHFKTPSTIADVLDAHVRNAVLHDPRSLILSRLRLTHNDAVRHWSGDHGIFEHNPLFPDQDRITRLRLALDAATQDPDALRNEHAWFFTPDSFTSILDDLLGVGLIDLRVERLYPTLFNALEFWAVLRKPDA